MSRVKTTVYSGITIGLLGGSFDPPHEGHLHITEQARRLFGLNQIWWVVSPGNPLKNTPSTSFSKRIKKCQEIVGTRNIFVSDVEVSLGTQFTHNTVKKLYLKYPGVRFIWLMGADNLCNFHNWKNWSWIMQNIPIGVMARPGKHPPAGLSLAARKYEKYRLKTQAARLLAFKRAPAWVLMSGKTLDISSSKIRSIGKPI